MTKEYKGDFAYAPEAVKDEWAELMSLISERSTKLDSSKWEHFTPQFLDTYSVDVDIDQVLKAARERRKLYQEQNIFQQEGHIKIDTNMPITLIPVGDIHWGNVYTNHELWEKHRRKILETPGVYTALFHNLVDNAIPAKFPSNLMANSVPPWEQFRVMRNWVQELDQAGKVLGAIWSDCHEGWSYRQAGVEAEKLLYGYEGRGFPVIENGGILHLKLGKQKYAIGLWHKQGPFNSRFNPEHALRQNRRLYHEGATDAEIGAHYHVTAASASYEGAKNRMKPVHWLKIGTYKGVPSGGEKEFITDKWAVEKFGTSGQTPGTAITLWNDRHEIDNSIDFDTAIEKHMAIRTYALVREMGLENKFEELMA